MEASVYLQGKNNQLKQTSVASAVIDVKSLTVKGNGVKEDGKLKTEEVVKLFELPLNCLITRTDVIVRKSVKGAGQIKVSADETDIFSSAALGQTVTALTPSTTCKFVPTGANITITVATADIEDGVFEVAVHYVELDRTTGEFLN